MKRSKTQHKSLHPNLEYNIIGDGELKEYFEKLIAELNVAHVVKLLGWKQQKEIVEILNTCHIFVAPSVTGTDGNQDAPVNTLKEAMAMGLPVISTLHGGIPELVEDGVSGFLVPERDADAIAQKLTYLIKHSQDWQKMGKAGRKRVEENYEITKLNEMMSWSQFISKCWIMLGYAVAPPNLPLILRLIYESRSSDRIPLVSTKLIMLPN